MTALAVIPHPHPCPAIESGMGCQACDDWLDQLAEMQGHPEPCDYTVHATYSEIVDHFLFEDGMCYRKLAEPKVVRP